MDVFEENSMKILRMVIAILCAVSWIGNAQDSNTFLAKGNACYSASKHLEDYKFSPPYSGKLKAVELHHISGDVTCSYNRVGTHWGCYTGSGEPTMFMLQMVRDNDGTVLPTVNTKNVDDLWGYASCGVGDCTVAGYNMNGYDVESDILRWDGPSLTVSTSDTFSLQISEGCCGTSVSDNRGIGCADVYFEYESIFVKELATNNACFSASEYLQDYKFSPPYSGKLKAVELHHISGDVTCSYNRVGTHWGCYTGSGEPTIFMLQMVRDNDGTVLPTVDTKNVDDLWEYSSCDCTVAGYNMNGYDVKSDLLRWDGPSLIISTSETFSLQISEGCCGTSVSDNEGAGCATVFFEYEWITEKGSARSANSDEGTAAESGHGLSQKDSGALEQESNTETFVMVMLCITGGLIVLCSGGALCFFNRSKTCCACLGTTRRYSTVTADVDGDAEMTKTDDGAALTM